MRTILRGPRKFVGVCSTMIAVMLGITIAATGCKPGRSEVRLKFESEKRFAMFQAQLQKELAGAIGRGGFQEAVKHCKIASPSIESKSSTGKFIMRRVSDKPRNPAHAPDEFEKRVLEKWKGILAAGGNIKTVGKRTPAGYRVMKPIRIGGGLCLKCHGGPEQLDAKALAEIRELYPRDRATGYKSGDLRGAFSAVWKD